MALDLSSLYGPGFSQTTTPGTGGMAGSPGVPTTGGGGLNPAILSQIMAYKDAKAQQALAQEKEMLAYKQQLQMEALREQTRMQQSQPRETGPDPNSLEARARDAKFQSQLQGPPTELNPWTQKPYVNTQSPEYIKWSTLVGGGPGASGNASIGNMALRPGETPATSRVSYDLAQSSAEDLETAKNKAAEAKTIAARNNPSGATPAATPAKA